MRHLVKPLAFSTVLTIFKAPKHSRATTALQDGYVLLLPVQVDKHPCKKLLQSSWTSDPWNLSLSTFDATDCWKLLQMNHDEATFIRFTLAFWGLGVSWPKCWTSPLSRYVFRRSPTSPLSRYVFGKSPIDNLLSIVQASQSIPTCHPHAPCTLSSFQRPFQTSCLGDGASQKKKKNFLLEDIT